KVYALCGSARMNGFQSFYSSTNGGQTWTAVYGEGTGSDYVNLLGWSETGDDTGGQAWYDLSLAVNPENSNEVFVGGVNIWKSTTGGASWQLNSHWTHFASAQFVHADHHMMAFSPLNNKLYCANDGGLYQNATLNQDWESISNGLEITQFYKIGLSNNASPDLVGGSQDQGTLLKRNGWSAILGGDGMECFFDAYNPDVIYGTYQNGILLRSDNGGYSFKNISPPNAGMGMWVTPFIAHPNNPNKILAGYDKIYSSSDKGETWVALNDQFNLHYPSDYKFQSLAYAPSNANIIYAAKRKNIWFTNNHGQSWTNITPGLPNEVITSVEVENDNPLSLWVTYSGFQSNEKVYHSPDGGQNWINISNGLPNIPVNDIACRPNSDQELFVGTDIGVYYRSSQDASWELFGDSLPSVVVNELEFDANNQKLWAATFGRGVWNCNLAEVSQPQVDFTCSAPINCVNTEMNLIYTGTSDYDSLIWLINGSTYTTLTDTLLFTLVDAGFYDVELKHYLNGTEKNKIKLGYIEATLNLSFDVYPTDIEIVGCAGEPVLIYATGNYEYHWTSSNGTVVTNDNVFEVQPNQNEEIIVSAGTGSCASSHIVTVNYSADNMGEAKEVGIGNFGPFYNDCATVEVNEPAPNGISCNSQNSWCPGENTLENSLWFRMLVVNFNDLIIEATGMDVQLAVYRAASAYDLLYGNYELLGANDNSETYTDGSAVVHLMGSSLNRKDKLWIQVDGGAAGETGSFQLNVQYADGYNINNLNETTVEALNVSTYPNPATDRLGYKVFLPSPGLLSLEVYDVQGTLVHQNKVETKQSIYEGYIQNQSNLSGIYFLVATSKTGRVLKKVIFE
ncbi:MAG: T9SS type A sorting domain-containing protein, partial [Bacteroidales bacterium]|nr:T9SS type A sorting domain-containing protein [Bacteroidales bacterium]